MTTEPSEEAAVDGENIDDRIIKTNLRAMVDPSGLLDEPGELDTSLVAWIDGREAWITEGVAKGFVVSEVYCATHDGTPMTPAEEETFDEGVDDPCIPIIRLGDEPGEKLIPRFGPGS